MPRQAVIVAPQKLGITEYELEELREGQVRVQSEFCAAKHGTEMATFKGYSAGRGPYDAELGCHVTPKDPTEPSYGVGWGVGNMFVGRITELGPGVTGVAVGDRVMGYGSFREVHTARAAHLWAVPAEMSAATATCLDPADFAMAAVRDGNVRIGDAVAVFGMGAIGLMAVQLCKISGASLVIAVEPLANRRAAAEACGADAVLDPTGCDAGMELRLATDKRGVDVAIDYSGSVHALQAALKGVAYGGTVVAGAYPPPYPAGLDLGAEAHLNIPNIVFSRACSEPNREHPRWNEKRIYATCWRLLCEGKLTGEPVVTPIVTLDEVPDAYPKIATAPETNIKLGVRF